MTTGTYDGSVCEIITSCSDSIIARVNKYTPTELVIVPRRNGLLLGNLKVATQVIIHIGSSKEKFIAVRGTLCDVTDNQIILNSLEVITNVNNRGYARVAVNTRAELILKGSSKPREIRIKDISLSGLSIECDFALGGVGAVFTLVLNIPTNRKPLEYPCVVVRTLPNKDTTYKKYGCKFTFKATDNTDMLWKFIQDQILLGFR